MEVATTTIYNLRQAQTFLCQGDSFCLEHLQNCFEEFLKDNEWTNYIEVQNIIKYKTELLCTSIASQYKDVHLQALAKVSVECTIFNLLHHVLMPILHDEFREEDEYYFAKIMDLSDVTAEQLGAPENYAIPLLAAVVELASLDNHKSPLEKLYCLCSTYDLLFAELKTALIDIISKFSVDENEIPVINNWEIIPILATVIVRSKLVHLYSNFYYMEMFIGSLNENNNIRHVLETFKKAIQLLNTVTSESLKPACEKVCRDLDLIKLIEVTSQIDKIAQMKKVTPLDSQLIRVANLIVASTSQI